MAPAVNIGQSACEHGEAEKGNGVRKNDPKRIGEVVEFNALYDMSGSSHVGGIAMLILMTTNAVATMVSSMNASSSKTERPKKISASLHPVISS